MNGRDETKRWDCEPSQRMRNGEAEKVKGVDRCCSCVNWIRVGLEQEYLSVAYALSSGRAFLDR